MEAITLRVTGMTCNHRVQAVTRALAECDGVESAEVDLDTTTAVVRGSDLDTNCLVRAVETAGYGASVSDNQEST